MTARGLRERERTDLTARAVRNCVLAAVMTGWAKSSSDRPPGDGVTAAPGERPRQPFGIRSQTTDAPERRRGVALAARCGGHHGARIRGLVVDGLVVAVRCGAWRSRSRPARRWGERDVAAPGRAEPERPLP